MFFSIGIEYPAHENEAIGIVVPALCTEEFVCFSAADTEAEITTQATEAIVLVVEEMLKQGANLEQIKDLGPRVYRENEAYQHCDAWVLLEKDLTEFMGKPKRINVSLPDGLIKIIDSRVQASQGYYKDRSHFLAIASRRELEK